MLPDIRLQPVISSSQYPYEKSGTNGMRDRHLSVSMCVCVCVCVWCVWFVTMAINTENWADALKWTWTQADYLLWTQIGGKLCSCVVTWDDMTFTPIHHVRLTLKLLLKFNYNMELLFCAFDCSPASILNSAFSSFLSLFHMCLHPAPPFNKSLKMKLGIKKWCWHPLNGYANVLLCLNIVEYKLVL